jgi:hypothetical protein
MAPILQHIELRWSQFPTAAPRTSRDLFDPAPRNRPAKCTAQFKKKDLAPNSGGP